jgi:N6-adenosine-specific RNA methylase IME4
VSDVFSGVSKSGPGDYRVIYADPPWLFGDANENGNRGASSKYPCMTMHELFAMTDYIDHLAANDCVLAMWWVSAMPQEALDLIKVWGFKLWNMQGLVWDKKTKNQKEFFGLGHSTRPSKEAMLFATRGKKWRENKGVRQAISATVGTHSEKPQEARDALVTLFGDVPRIELFARKRVDGWDCWGNEI